MKLMIATDIHGSKTAAEKLLLRFSAERADSLVLLGDLYYHGPRNPLPEGYAPIEVAKLLNSVKDKLVVIKGNCDSEVDEMVSEFKFLPKATAKIGEHTVLFTHGHVYNADNLPPEEACDVMFYGHFHINAIAKKGGIVAVNVASASLPMHGAEAAYSIMDENTIVIKNLDGKELSSYKL